MISSLKMAACHARHDTPGLRSQPDLLYQGLHCTVKPLHSLPHSSTFQDWGANIVFWTPVSFHPRARSDQHLQ